MIPHLIGSPGTHKPMVIIAEDMVFTGMGQLLGWFGGYNKLCNNIDRLFIYFILYIISFLSLKTGNYDGSDVLA